MLLDCFLVRSLDIVEPFIQNENWEEEKMEIYCAKCDGNRFTIRVDELLQTILVCNSCKTAFTLFSRET